MDGEAAFESGEKGASSESVEQRPGSEQKPESIARKQRRDWQSIREQAEKHAEKEAEKEMEREARAEAARQAAAVGMTTPTPRRPAPMPTPPAPVVASRRSTSNKEDPMLWSIPDEYPSQVDPTQEEELVAESPPLQRSRPMSGVTESVNAHHLFEDGQADTPEEFMMDLIRNGEEPPQDDPTAPLPAFFSLSEEGSDARKKKDKEKKVPKPRGFHIQL